MKECSVAYPRSEVKEKKEGLFSLISKFPGLAPGWTMERGFLGPGLALGLNTFYFSFSLLTCTD